MSINLTNTAAAATAAEIIASKSAPSKKKLTEEQEAGRDKTLQALAARAAEGTRVTYGRLAELALENGWLNEAQQTKTTRGGGKFAGQVGSGLISQVPSELQPFVCKSDGRYDKKAKAKFWDHLPTVGESTPEEVCAILRYLPAEGPGGAMKTFERKTSAKAEAEVTEEAAGAAADISPLN